MAGFEMVVTLLLIGVTLVASFLGFRDPGLLQKLIMWPPAVTRERQYYRLLSYGLVHADAQHLLFNMLTLFFFGAAIERLFTSYLGAAGFALFYAGGLVVSILPSYLMHRHDTRYRSLGASGAVSAVLFAFILFQPWATILVFFIPVPAIVYAVAYVAYTLYMSHRRSDNINHSAHLWGAAYGVVFTLVMEPRVLAVFVERLTHP